MVLLLLPVWEISYFGEWTLQNSLVWKRNLIKYIVFLVHNSLFVNAQGNIKSCHYWKSPNSSCFNYDPTFYARVFWFDICVSSVRCDSLVLWYYVQPAHMDVVDSLSTASGADTVPSLDFDLITTVESENLWCEQCKVFKKVGVYLWCRL